MSTARPLPLDPLPTVETYADAPAQALRDQVAERLQQHRRRRGQMGDGQPALPGMDTAGNPGWATARPNRVADSVAARFAKSVSYRDYLQQEAEAAVRQAEAAAEVARRTAEAIAEAQQQLLDEIDQWNRTTEQGVTTLEVAEVITIPVATEPASVVLAASPATLEKPAVSVRITVAEPPADKPASSIAATPAAAPQAEPRAAFTLPAQPLEPLEPPTPLPTNLIEFPRQLVAARKARPRFAEGPLREDADDTPERAQLRIFEVEADAFSTVPEVAPASSLPEWSSIRLDSWTAPHETTVPDAQVSFALPIYAAPVSRRVMATAVDGCCIATAFLLAVAAAAVAGDALPTGMLAAGASFATLLLFAVGYMLLCFSLAGQTFGMRYARIALCTFGDDNPTRSAMRRRLFAMALSGATFGLGFAWALLDDDKLGWHDRISRMYQRAY